MRTTMNEYPRDCTMWIEAFQAKYDGVGKFDKEQWDQLLGKYSVSLCSTRKKYPADSLTSMRGIVCV